MSCIIQCLFIANVSIFNNVVYIVVLLLHVSGYSSISMVKLVVLSTKACTHCRSVACHGYSRIQITGTHFFIHIHPLMHVRSEKEHLVLWPTCSYNILSMYMYVRIKATCIFPL